MPHHARCLLNSLLSQPLLLWLLSGTSSSSSTIARWKHLPISNNSVVARAAALLPATYQEPARSEHPSTSSPSPTIARWKHLSLQ